MNTKHLICAALAALSLNTWALDWTGQPDYWIEYAEATCRQAVDTGVLAKSPVRMEADMTFTSKNSGYQFLGAYCSNGTYLYFPYYNNPGWMYGYNKKMTAVPVASIPAHTANTRYILSGSLAAGAQSMSVNDGTTTYSYNSSTAGEVDTGCNFYLFGRDFRGLSADLLCKAKCWNLKIWTNTTDTLACDLVPCVKNREVCFYDKVTGEYRRNVTTDFLHAGPSLSQMTIDAIPAQVWDGEGACTPTVTVRSLGGDILTEGTDYTLTWQDNAKCGVAMACVAGKGTYENDYNAIAFVIRPTSDPVTWYTSPTATEGDTGLSADHPLTIHDAVYCAQDGDTVIVQKGTYYIHKTVEVNTAIHLVGTGACKEETILRHWQGEGAYTDSIRIMSVTANAVIDNLTVSHGRWTADGCNIDLQAGTVTNCLIASSQSRLDGEAKTAFNVAAGALAVDCVISNNYNRSANNAMVLYGTARRCRIVNNTGRGACGGVCLKGSGLLVDSEISGNASCAAKYDVGGCAYYGGGGVYVDSANAVVSNCVITGNHVDYCSLNTKTTYHRGGGIYFNKAGKVYNSVISRNFAHYDGGGVYGKGYLYNCVITDNVTSNATGGAIYGDVELYNCTVAGNRTLLAEKVGGITGAAKLTNSILWDNYTAVPGETPVLSNYDNATFDTCYTMPATTGATETDPLFRDAENGDYRLSHTSPAINQIATMPAYLPEIDARGQPRFFAGALDLGGFEDGNEFTVQFEPSSVAAPATPSVGLHEQYEIGAQVTCSVTTPYPGAGAPTNSVCTGYRYATRTSEADDPVVTEGPESTVTVTAARFSDLTWFFGNSYKTTVVSQDPEKGTVSMSEAYHPQGEVFTVTATPAAGYKFMYWLGDVPEADRTKATITLTSDRARNLTAVFGGVWYVDGTNGNDDNAGTASAPFKTIHRAVTNAVDYDEVHIAPGKYPISSTVVITNALHLIGQGTNPTDVCLDHYQGPGDYNRDTLRIMSVENDLAVVENLTVRYGRYTADGMNVNLAAGTLKNCVVASSQGRTDSFAKTALNVAAGALVVDCVISNNYNRGYYSGMVLAGTALRCKILDNIARNFCGGVKLTGNGRLIDSVVRGNLGNTYYYSAAAWYGNGGGAGVYVDSANAVVSNCVIEANRENYYYNSGNKTPEQCFRGGGIYFKNAGKVYNSVIRNNFAHNDGGGVYGPGKLYNCLIADNVTSNAMGGAVCGGAELVNCTIVGNSAQTADMVGGVSGAAKITNAIVYDNYTAVPGTTPVLSNYDSATIDHSLTSPLAAGEGNKTGDPQFRNAARGWYQVRPTSPAADGGIWLDVLTGCLRLDGTPMIDAKGRLPMGCYGIIDAGTIILLR